MSIDRSSLVADKHEIETLQRLYAKATDAIGLGSSEKIEEGRAIYHRIYTDDVDISTANTGAKVECLCSLILSSFCKLLILTFESAIDMSKLLDN